MDTIVVPCPTCKDKIMLYMRNKQESHATEKCSSCGALVWIEDEDVVCDPRPLLNSQPGIRIINQKE